MHLPYSRPAYSAEQMLERATDYRTFMEERRSLRFFSDKPVAKQVIEQLIMAASTAPSGAHKQPWIFCAIGSADIKSKIKEAAEAEERENYSGRMSESWLKDLAPFGTDANKPFLEIAPWLIVVFKRAYELGPEGEKLNNYYVNESVGLAAGFLLTAIHNAGLVALTHTPSPMNFLTKLLDRPANERPFLLIPVGYAAEEATVPQLERKGAEEVIEWY